MGTVPGGRDRTTERMPGQPKPSELKNGGVGIAYTICPVDGLEARHEERELDNESLDN